MKNIKKKKKKRGQSVLVPGFLQQSYIRKDCASDSHLLAVNNKILLSPETEHFKIRTASQSHSIDPLYSMNITSKQY
jgi:hypothetical protein